MQKQLDVWHYTVAADEAWIVPFARKKFDFIKKFYCLCIVGADPISGTLITRSWWFARAFAATVI